ncbi:MAG: hypothetical protein U1E39_08910 [Planctomycetota bacterium]
MDTPPSRDARPGPPRPSADADHAWILVTGDPVSGFCFYGPFPARSAAEDARDEQAINLRRESWVAELWSPGYAGG